MINLFLADEFHFSYIENGGEGCCMHSMKELGEMMAWLMGEVGDEEENNKAFKD